MRVVGSNLTQGSSSSFLWKGRAVLGVVDLFDLPCLSTSLPRSWDMRHRLHTISRNISTVPLQYTACFMFSEACIEPIRKILRISLGLWKFISDSRPEFTEFTHQDIITLHKLIIGIYTLQDFVKACHFGLFELLLILGRHNSPTCLTMPGENTALSHKSSFSSTYLFPPLIPSLPSLSRLGAPS